MNLEDLIQDIPEDLARRAHSGTSFVPEQRAQQERASYATTLVQDHATLSKYADTDEKQAALETDFARYRAGYCTHYKSWLEAQSHCVSWMITGPSNFPARRNEKRNNTERKRREEMHAYRTRALAAITRVLRPELSPIMTGDSDAAARIETKLEALERRQENMKAINAAIRTHAKAGTEAQIAALVALGCAEYAARKLVTPPYGRPGYTWELTNNGAEIRRLKGRAVTVAVAQATPDATAEGANARIEDCPADNRVRLFFPGKPASDVRTRLKACGFRWTPTLGCWQAYRNPNALATAAAVAQVTP